jgi:hypothetical protein
MATDVVVINPPPTTTEGHQGDLVLATPPPSEPVLVDHLNDTVTLRPCGRIAQTERDKL